MGLHLTIDGWRKGRNSDGWRNVGWSEEDIEDEGSRTALDLSDSGPEEVEVKARLKSDVIALTTLTHGDQPPLQRVRSDQVCEVLYGFGDASGLAFETTLGKGSEVHYEYGQWLLKTVSKVQIGGN